MAILKSKDVFSPDEIPEQPPEYTEQEPPQSQFAVAAVPQEDSQNTNNHKCDVKAQPRFLHTQNINYVRKNSSIKENFVLDLSAVTTDEPLNGYDALVESKNGSITVDLEIRGKLRNERPAKILVKSQNGSVKATIRTASPLDQHTFNIDIQSTNGSVRGLIPQNVTGDLEISSNNGSTKLLSELLSRSEPRTESHYVIRPPVGQQQQALSVTPSHIALKSKNGSITAGFADSSDASVGSCSGLCVIS